MFEPVHCTLNFEPLCVNFSHTKFTHKGSKSNGAAPFLIYILRSQVGGLNFSSSDPLV